MANRTNDLLTEVAGYYSNRLVQHGETAAGVDWKDQEGQVRRFEQLLKVVDRSASYSLCDVGCGYGALVDHMTKLGYPVKYLGLDVSATMVDAAKRRFSHVPHVQFEVGNRPQINSDYTVASGIFNVKLGSSTEEWSAYLFDTLDMMNDVSDRGFAFNCLTSYSDDDKMRSDLFYADPLVLFDRCKRRYSRHVSLLHDYGLYEFTIVVRRHA